MAPVLKPAQIAKLRDITTLETLIEYLHDELDWPLDLDNIDDAYFDYDADEIGLDPANAAKIKSIKQLRPSNNKQPWGIFFVEFNDKQLPIVALRRILRGLVVKRRNAGADRYRWQTTDLLFVSAFGEVGDRQITFAHFTDESEHGDLPVLRVLGWDPTDNGLQLTQVANSLHENLHWPSLPEDVETWRVQWASAFRLKVNQVINDSKSLAALLAVLAARIRNRADAVLLLESERGPLRKMAKAFRESLISDLDDNRFADMYAQTVTYGLFAVRVSRASGGLVADDLHSFVSTTSPFLKEMLGSFLDASGRSRSRANRIDFDELGINDLVEALRAAPVEAIVAAFGSERPDDDPVIHFYENFLKAYDNELRVQRGVFYTPKSIVSYIVRSAHELLQIEFGLVDGLADISSWSEVLKKRPDLKLPALTDESGDKRTISPEEPFVQILDPATGTATFLVEVIDVIYRTLTAKWTLQRLTSAQQVATWNDYVPKHLLPRLHAFELMMAPYAIAHMKISLKLADTGYLFATDERARIYLTNALEPWAKQLPLIGFDALAHEASAVNEIKLKKHFTVVIGNPPYSASSWNMGIWITELAEDYKRTVRREESQIQALSNDYIKFLRFGAWHIERTGVGVLGLITGHGYLQGTQPRDLRKHLSSNFDKCYCLDLHGSVRRAGTRDIEDEPVFEIMTGVAILLGVRCAPHEKRASTVLESLTGRTEKKFKYLRERTALTTLSPDAVFHPIAPYYYFAQSATPQNVSDEYFRFPDLPAIFGTGNRQEDKEIYWATGFTSQQDELAISFSESELVQKMQALAESESFNDLRRSYRLCTTDQWNYLEAKDFVKNGLWKKHVEQVLYRPFDRRWTVLHKHVLTILRNQVMSQFSHGKNQNLGLISSRAVNDLTYAHCFVTNERVDRTFISSKTSTNAYVFPLFFKANDMYGQQQRPNFSRGFLASLATVLGLDQTGEFGIPEGLTANDIFHYTYALLHCPAYRNRYSEILKIDFPRLPLTGNLKLFLELAKLGAELVEHHLLVSPTTGKPIVKFAGSASPAVEKVSWSENNVWLDFAQTIGFSGVQENVWKFHVGGYQVCEKWLKDRKGHKLSNKDIVHYQEIVVSLSETIRLMAEIDRAVEAAGGFPRAFSSLPASSGASAKATDAESTHAMQKARRAPETKSAVDIASLFEGLDPVAPPVSKRLLASASSKRHVKANEIGANDAMAAFRECLAHGQLARGELIRDAAHALGVERAGKLIKEVLDGHLRAAVRRGIVANERGMIRLAGRTIEDFERDVLKDQFVAALAAEGHGWVGRTDAIRAFARWLGFTRTGEKIEAKANSLINGLLREGRLEAEGTSIRKAR